VSNAAIASLILSADVLYGVACARFGSRPSAPLWLRWPLPVWEFIVQGPKPAPRPDYARIERLERELGIVDEEPRLPIKRASRPCLVKDCQGDTQTVETWGGQVLYRVHRCEGGRP
jgi:hypothetical protein